jgi:hypothetical protein
MSDENEAPQEQSNPWEPWQQAGFDPSEYDPNDVRNAYEGWNALADRDQRPYLIERMLQGNEIPDGMSLGELQEAANLYWQAKNDPFGNEDYMYSEDQAQYSEPYGAEYGGTEAPVGYDSSPGIDPNYLRSVWQQDVESIVEQRLAEMEQQYQERAQFDEFRTERGATSMTGDAVRLRTSHSSRVAHPRHRRWAVWQRRRTSRPAASRRRGR